MTKHSIFEELPPNAVHPEGWLLSYLENQRSGLTGHLEAAKFPFDTYSWASTKDEALYRGSWEPYEQNGYWIDGMIRCGYLLDDSFLLGKAMKYIDYVLKNPDVDGYLGPKYLKSGSRWPHTVFFRALMAYYSATGDEKVITALTKHYLSETSTHEKYREVCNIEIILWLYEKTGNVELLQYAEKIFDAYNRLFPSDDTSMENLLSEKRSTCHGVSYNEISKLGAILYMYTQKEKYLNSAVNAFKKIDRDQMLIDGVMSSAEELGGKDSLDSHETCDIADYTWALGYLLLAVGNVEYADKIERACFNAAPSAVRSDFKGLQYFSCPNQVIADKTSNHTPYVRGHAWMSYRPSPGTQCCPGNVNRIMPNYAARMWLSDGKGGLAAAMYGPSRITAKVGESLKEITIVEETAYPFSDQIDFHIHTDSPASFTLALRIPSWCTAAQVLLNGTETGCRSIPGSFVKLTGTFSDNDRVTLRLPMELHLSRWPGGGIGIERGPLVYSLRIEEDWRVDSDDKMSTNEFPAWNLYPASPWNYALDVSEENLEDVVEIVHRPVSLKPWCIHTAPVELHVPARRVSGWDIEKDKITEAIVDTRDGQKCIPVKGDFTPALPDPETLDTRLDPKAEKVTLVPYGCTKLRITIFPQVSNKSYTGENYDK